jgi:hypothetical protein
MNGQLHDLAYLLPRKMLLVPIEEEAAEVPEPVSVLTKKKKFLAFVENRTMIL